MKTCRKPVAMVLLLLIHLLTLQIGDAGRNRTNVSSAKSDPKIILEEVTIAGSGNNTRVIANAVAEDASRLDDEILSLLLLSKREKRGSRRSEQTSSNWDQDDQDAAQSRVNLDEEADLEMLNRVIAKYEPQRITVRKIKRKIVDGPNGTHDIQDKVAGSVTELERAYAKVLRNISRNAPELTVNNPYLSQAMKQLKQIYIPETTIHSVIDDGAQKSRSDVDSSFTSPILKSKKSKKLIKKYSQLNRVVTTPPFSPVEESKPDEKTAGNNESSTPVVYFKSNGKTEPKNGSLSVPNVYLGRPKSHREWNIQNSSVQAPPPFTSRLDNSKANSIINANNLKNVPSDVNAVQLPPRYNVVPRPFSISQSPNSPVTASIDVSYRKPSLSPAGFGHQQQVAPSSANILPLVLPTDLLNPLPARRYVPIKRANRLNLEGNSATIVSTEASRSTSPVGKTTLADYGALYTNVIGTTSSPLVTVNSQESYVSSDYYPITESPSERTVTATNFATTYIPSQTSASYTVQRQKDSQVVPGKNQLLPRITTYNSPDDEKSSSNENLGIALYNKFANLYPVNVPNVFDAPKAITQNFKQPVQPSQQQVSALPYVTLEPLASTLPKVRPIVFSKPLAPYYDSRLLVSQDVDGKLNKNSEENVKASKQFRTRDAGETEKEDDDDNDNFENHNNQTSREAYKAYKTPNKQHEKEDREEEEDEDRYPQQSRNYGYQDKHDKDDGSSRNDDRPGKYENVRHEDNDDEEEVDETEEEEYVSTGKSKDEDNNDRRRQYNKYEYDRDNSEEEERDKLHYDRKKYNKPRGRHGKHDYGSDVEHRFENSNKYYKSLFNDDETREHDKEYRDRSDKKKLVDDKQYKKSRQDRRYQESEDESVAEDKPFAQHSKDQHAYRQDERYEREQNNDDDKRKYHQASPRRDSLHEEHKREEYGESNPKHTREEYHQRAKDEHRGHHRRESEAQDDGKGKARDHVHGETQEHAQKHEEHHEKKKGGGPHKFEEGGGAEHEKEHHGHEGEKGEKGYKVWHEHEKAEKGHHDKEHASKHYDEKDGKEKKHEEDGGYHEEHHHGEEGKKTAEFGEKGEHKKGHSTHGEHSVHKKDEYEKNTEFFDEFHEDGGMEKHGEHHHDHESKKGGHEKKGHHDGADHEEKYGKEKKHEEGGHHHEHKGHKVDEGHDHHYDHDHKHGKKEGHEYGKKWSFKKGDGGGDAGGDHKHNR